MAWLGIPTLQFFVGDSNKTYEKRISKVFFDRLVWLG